jgi:eukaryotic-like serine/threonine-protein kinase
MHMNTLSYERGSLGRWAGAVLQDTYRLGRLVARSAVAEVYEAGHVRLPGNFLVKVLHPELAANPEAFERLCREAEIISSLRHPYVAQIFDFSVTPEGLPYFVMEALEGTDLGSRIAQRGALPPAAVSRIVEAVAAALGAAHARGIVHGDLRPERVLLVPVEGQEEESLKVLDFGVGGRPGGGEARYLAPEQALGRDVPVDARSDQFALGSLAYTMLTGRDAFAGNDVAEVLYRIVHEAPPPLARFVPCDTGPMQAVLDRAMAKSPAARFASVRDLARALTAATAALEATPVPVLLSPVCAADPRAVAVRAPAAPVHLEVVSAPAPPPPEPPAVLAPAPAAVPAAVPAPQPAPIVDWELPSSVDRVPVTRHRAAVLGIVALALAGFVIAKGWYRELPADLDFIRQNAVALITRAEARPQPVAPEPPPAAAPSGDEDGDGVSGQAVRTAPSDDSDPPAPARP